jgi:hypothetical protein
MACWYVTKPPVWSVEFVVAGARVPGRAEPPVAVGETASPWWLGLVKPAVVLAEMWMVSEAPALSKRLRVPGRPEVDSVRRWLGADRDSWSWRRT